MIEKLTLKTAVEFAVKTEQLGAQIYQRLAKRFGDRPELGELFEALARDEVVHEGQFVEMLRGLEQPDGPLPYEQDQYLRAMSISEVFSGLHKGFEQVESREDALGRALQLEKNTILYYQAMAEVLGPSETLEQVIAVEKQHVVRIARLLITGEKMHSEGD